MYFEPNKIYHIYNQGNNREYIFYYAGLQRCSLCKKRLARRLLGEGVTGGVMPTR